MIKWININDKEKILTSQRKETDYTHRNKNKDGKRFIRNNPSKKTVEQYREKNLSEFHTMKISIRSKNKGEIKTFF